MREQSHEGDGNSTHRKMSDQVEQHEAKPPKSHIRDPGATVGQLDSPSLDDGAEAFLKQTGERILEIEKWSESGEVLLRGKGGEWMDHLKKETMRWNTFISNVDRPEDAELLYDASVSFAMLTQVGPEDSQELAKAADAAYAYFDKLLGKTKLPIVSEIGQLLESARHLFELGREAFDPIRRPSYRSHHDIIRGPTTRHPDD